MQEIPECWKLLGHLCWVCKQHCRKMTGLRGCEAEWRDKEAQTSSSKAESQVRRVRTSCAACLRLKPTAQIECQCSAEGFYRIVLVKCRSLGHLMISMVALKQALDNFTGIWWEHAICGGLKMELGDTGLAARWEAR